MKKRSPLAKRTPSYQAHQRQFVWQILLPVLVAALLFIAGGVAAATRSAGTASRWADISLIWLLIPALIVALIVLVLLISLIYGLGLLLNITPEYTSRLRRYIYQAQRLIEKAADEAAQPVLFLEGVSAGIKRFFRHQ
jgi:predicted PurR-regulated permease PerM